jgi:uncharacterized protein (DUF697 family)
LIILPAPAVAPVMPPVIVPIVHAKLLGVLAVKVVLKLVPLQMLAVGGLVTAGDGFTVTVIVYEEPTHEPVVDVGVTI